MTFPNSSLLQHQFYATGGELLTRTVNFEELSENHLISNIDFSNNTCITDTKM